MRAYAATARQSGAGAWQGNAKGTKLINRKPNNLGLQHFQVAAVGTRTTDAKLINLRQHDRQCVSVNVFLWGPY